MCVKYIFDGKWLIFCHLSMYKCLQVSLGTNMSACVCARVPSNIALKQISFSHVVTFNKYRCPSCKRALRSPRLATMKERASSAKKDRTYDADGYTQRAGCLCFKTDSEKEVCGYMFKESRSVDPI